MDSAISQPSAPSRHSHAQLTLAGQQPSFFGRHPAATLVLFGVSPILAHLAFTVIAIAAVLLAAQVVGWAAGDPMSLTAFVRSASPYLLTLLAVVLPSAASTLIFFRVSKWARISVQWTLVSCAVLSLLAAASFCQLQFSEAPGKNSLTLGLGLGAQTFELRPLLQASVPLLVGTCLWWRSRLSTKVG